MLPLLYQDEHLLAVHKPSGLLVHRTKIDANERRFALQIVREQTGRRIYTVHRLDKGTSGVLLFALTRETGAAMSQLFATGQVHKTYVAIVRGHTPSEGEIDYALRPPIDDPEASRPLQPALTRYKLLASIDLPYQVDRYPSTRYSLVEIEPITGRQHQIRRHMKHISHPVIGDANYGKGRHNRLFQTLFGSNRLLLACVGVRFQHPLSAAQLSIRAPLADDFGSVVEHLGWTEQLGSALRAR